MMVRPRYMQFPSRSSNDDRLGMPVCSILVVFIEDILIEYVTGIESCFRLSGGFRVGTESSTRQAYAGTVRIRAITD